jgi:hypothetical protein
MRNVSFVLLALLLPASLATTACAAQDREAAAGENGWIPLGTAPGATVWLDASRVELSGTEHTVWLRFNYREPDPVPGEPGKQFWGIRSQHRLGCAARTVTDLQMFLLDREGKQLEDEPLEGGRWKTFADHPFGTDVFPMACQWLQRNRPVQQ